MLLVAIGADVLAGRRRAKLGWCAVLVGGADKQDFGTRLTAKTGVHIGGQQRADEVAEMFDAVDVGNGAGHEIAGHGLHPLRGRRTLKNEKALPSGRKSSGS